MIPKRQNIYLHLMGQKKDLKSSKQTCWMKDLLILQLMLVMVFSIRSALKPMTLRLEDEKPNEATYRISRERAESSLGINFSSWEVTLKDTIESLKEKGFLSF
ncbi:hypothetical protein LWI28_012042 [Acer negundo]|uniref:Uncharacterized protein n=1 Tax=Acer negundo TaxID=4023 RepID=A0AAD5NN71_ACENE|nr:hypothetical protein LWI28_012042 [Acer negundo]